ncbi:hypothetical protein DITRI_Ditri03aG0084400 [Diplodiscus trichospermus]
MESKRREFKKSKAVMSLYQAPKPSSSVQYYSNTVKPSPSGSMASTAFMDRSTKQKQYSYIASDAEDESYGRVEQYNYDEGIDARAANYISGVRQRFNLERGD